MFHGVGMNAAANTRLEEKNIRERLDTIVTDQKRIGSIITQHSTITDDEVAELFLQQQTKDANFALDKGIVHEIREVVIPSGTPVIPLIFQR